ncbi:hypothetical protein DYB28_004292 [Aphanomyces astaci]|uniref:START domain-containing protein n=2 Tax=Aphanomyces astaci TaxID=112090 RepID=A0A3L6UNX5_APHAT|nr:hypothetical protein DYB26_005221 [Aphanomyces astaci]RLN77332.1 hypothetical protein DYB28_004292 [Aphanomyces astaci]
MQAAGLPPQYAAELTKLAKVNTKVLLACSSPRNSNAGSPIQWTPLGKPVDGGVQLYTGNDSSIHDKSQSALNLVCGVVYVQAPLHEVSHALGNLTTNPYLKRVVDDPVVIDSRTLYDMDKRDRRATRIQWMSIRSASALMQHRDFVVVQHQDEVAIPSTSSRGSTVRGWVSCIHSVNLPMVPPFTQTYLRGGVYASGFVLRETNQRRITEAVVVLKVDFKGYAPRLLCTGTLKAWAMCVGRVAKYFRTHRSADNLHLPRVHLDDAHQLAGNGRNADQSRPTPKQRHAPSRSTSARQVPSSHPVDSPKQQPKMEECPHEIADVDKEVSPRFTQDIPMRPSAATWMDTLRCDRRRPLQHKYDKFDDVIEDSSLNEPPPPTKEMPSRPRQGSMPTPRVGQVAALHHGEPPPCRRSLTPTSHHPSPRHDLEYATSLAPPIRLKSSHTNEPLVRPWVATTTSTTISSTVAQCSFETSSDDTIDRASSGLLQLPYDLETSITRTSDVSVVEAFTSTGNVLDLTKGDIASFRL